jgi:hypothetical protein
MEKWMMQVETHKRVPFNIKTIFQTCIRIEVSYTTCGQIFKSSKIIYYACGALASTTKKCTLNSGKHNNVGSLNRSFTVH